LKNYQAARTGLTFYCWCFFVCWMCQWKHFDKNIDGGRLQFSRAKAATAFSAS